MRARKVDANHTRLSQSIRAIGIRLFDTSAYGRGFPDACCLYRGVCFLVEFKDGSKAKSARKLTKAQEAFWKDWGDVCYLIESEQDVIDLKNKLDFDLKEWK